MTDEILSPKEIRLVKGIWQRYRQYKVELEDLLQEARMLKFQNKNIQTGLEKYCQHWNRDVLSRACPIKERNYEPETEEEDMPEEEILEYLRRILSARQFEVWYRAKVENCSIYQIAQEMGTKEKIIYKHLQNAEEKIAEKREEIRKLVKRKFD